MAHQLTRMGLPIRRLDWVIQIRQGLPLPHLLPLVVLRLL